MDTYETWVDLAPGVNDLEFVRAVETYLGYLRGLGHLEAFRIRRRKLGFGPPDLGEFNISMEFQDLAQMDEAFLRAARRDPEVESLHAAVFSRVRGFRSALYRDFPDPVREGR